MDPRPFLGAPGGRAFYGVKVRIDVADDGLYSDSFYIARCGREERKVKSTAVCAPARAGAMSVYYQFFSLYPWLSVNAPKIIMIKSTNNHISPIPVHMRIIIIIPVPIFPT